MLAMLATIACLHNHMQSSKKTRIELLISGVNQKPSISKFQPQQLEEASDPAAKTAEDKPIYSYSTDPWNFMSRKQLGLFLLEKYA